MGNNFLLVGSAGDAGQEAGGTRFGEMAGVHNTSGETGGRGLAEEAESLARGSEWNLILIHAEGGLIYFYAVGMNRAAGVRARPKRVAQVSAIKCDGWKTIPSELSIRASPADSTRTPVSQTGAIGMKENYTSGFWD